MPLHSPVIDYARPTAADADIATAALRLRPSTDDNPRMHRTGVAVILGVLASSRRLALARPRVDALMALAGAAARRRRAAVARRRGHGIVDRGAARPRDRRPAARDARCSPATGRSAREAVEGACPDASRPVEPFEEMSQTAENPTPPPAPSPTPAPRRSGSVQPVGRRTRVVVRKVGPWSVLKFSLLFYLCVMLIVYFALMIIYWLLSAVGAIDSAGRLLGLRVRDRRRGGERSRRDPVRIRVRMAPPGRAWAT